MLEMFRAGGWGMYPTLFSGLFLLGAAIQYARRPVRDGQRLLWVLSGLTLMAGTLGFVTGFIRTLMHAPEAGMRGVELIWVGTAESLHNIALALSLIIAATIATAVGVAKQRRAADG